MSPLAWTFVHIAAGATMWCLGMLAHKVLTSTQPQPPTSEATDTTADEATQHVLTVTLGGRVVQLYSDQPFGPDTIRGVEQLLTHQFGPVVAVAGVRELIDAIVANEAAGLDDELDALGGAA